MTRGVVVDSSGGMVPGARVRIIDILKGTQPREAVTDETGRFRAINIEPGQYKISIELQGFKKTEIPVTLHVNAKLDIGEVKLEVGGVSEVISVNESSVPLVVTNTSEKAYLVDTRQITTPPMNGRNWVALMNTVPGMSSGARNDFETQAYANYNAMMARVGRRFANSLSFNLNYTWSRAMDIVDNDDNAIIIRSICARMTRLPDSIKPTSSRRTSFTPFPKPPAP